MKKICDIVQLQYADVKRALYRMRNHLAAPWMAKFEVNQVNWSAKKSRKGYLVFFYQDVEEGKKVRTGSKSKRKDCSKS